MCRFLSKKLVGRGVRAGVSDMEKGGPECRCLVWALSSYSGVVFFLELCACVWFWDVWGESNVNRADGKEMDCHHGVSGGHMMSTRACMCAHDWLICIPHRKIHRRKQASIAPGFLLIKVQSSIHLFSSALSRMDGARRNAILFAAKSDLHLSRHPLCTIQSR